MSAAFLTTDEKHRWIAAGGTALIAHLALGLLATAWDRETASPMPEPVVLIELPPAAAPPTTTSKRSTTEPTTQVEKVSPPQPTPLFKVPPVHAPLPKDAVLISNAPPLIPVHRAKPTPVKAAPAEAQPPVNTSVPAATGTNAAPTTSSGDNAAARKQKADYYAMVSAHLNQRKKYPAEARKARQQGVVKVRFTVDRSGNVSGVSIKGSSGFDILDQETMALLRRVAPLPRMPSSMTKSSVTITLPIDYSLRTR